MKNLPGPASDRGASRASDLLFAVVAGLGIGFFGYKALASAKLQGILPGEPWMLFLLGPLAATAGILVAGWLRPHMPVVFEIAKFGLVGALSTTIDLAVLNLLMETTGTFRGNLFPLLKAASFFAALLNAYLWNRHWTFHRRGVVWRQGGIHQFSLFATAAIGGLVLNVTVATLVVNLVPLPHGWLPIQLANVGALTALGGTATWDFLCYKFIVFRPAKHGEGLPAGHSKSL